VAHASLRDSPRQGDAELNRACARCPARASSWTYPGLLRTRTTQPTANTKRLPETLETAHRHRTQTGHRRCDGEMFAFCKLRAKFFATETPNPPMTHGLDVLGSGSPPTEMCGERARTGRAAGVRERERGVLCYGLWIP
jgi:hypothetical protein